MCGGSILINKVKMLLVVDARTGKPGQTKLRLPPTLALPLIGGTNPTPGLYCARRRVPLGSPSHFLLHIQIWHYMKDGAKLIPYPLWLTLLLQLAGLGSLLSS